MKTNELPEPITPTNFKRFSPPGDEHPEFAEVYAYWQELQAGRIAPSWDDVDLLEIPNPALPRVSVVDSNSDSTDFTYRFWGTGICGMYEADLSQKSVLDLEPPDYANAVFQQYKIVVASKCPEGFLLEGPTGMGISTQYAVMRLPLSSDGVKIDKVISIETYSESYEMLRTRANALRT